MIEEPLIYHYATSRSTNLDAMELAEKVAHKAVVVIADEQSGGVGRNGKYWHSPKGNLYCSIVLHKLLHIPTLSFLAALAVGTSLEEVFASVNTRQDNVKEPCIQYKWPNDVMVNAKKISGILLQTKTLGNSMTWIVCGIGVNISNHPEYATSVKDINPCICISNLELLDVILKNFRKLFNAYQCAGFSILRDLWLRKAYNIGNDICITTSTNICHKGKFIDIDMDGALILLTENDILKIDYGKML